MIFIASATMGLESVVKEECLALGFKNIKVFDGRVEFEGDFKDLVKANIYLRCSDRVFIKMAEFKALSYEELFQNVKAIEWQDFIDENGEFPISWVSSVKSKLYSKSDIQRISKKAIVEKLKPLTIKVEKTSINFNIRLNPLLTIDSIESVAIEDKGLKEALNKLYKAFKIEKGDRVLVKRVGNIFYILSKVVEA